MGFPDTHLGGCILGKRKSRFRKAAGRWRVRPPKVEFEFTDLDLTAFGGASILARTASWFGLFELLDGASSVKVSNRGASDAETLWAVFASLARGHGALSDLEALRDAAVRFAERVAPAVVAYEVETRGYVPLFIDATGIEVDGGLFERARRGCDGSLGHWLHAMFLGGLWSAGQLQPGGGRVTLNWRKLLEWTAGMAPEGRRRGCGRTTPTAWEPLNKSRKPRGA